MADEIQTIATTASSAPAEPEDDPTGLAYDPDIDEDLPDDDEDPDADPPVADGEHVEIDDDTGQPRSRVNFSGGRLNGPYVEYGDNGEPVMTASRGPVRRVDCRPLPAIAVRCSSSTRAASSGWATDSFSWAIRSACSACATAQCGRRSMCIMPSRTS